MDPSEDSAMMATSLSTWPPSGWTLHDRARKGLKLSFLVLPIIEVIFISFHDLFCGIVTKIRKIGNNNQEFYFERFKFSRKIAPCVHKLSYLGRFTFDSLRGAFWRLEHWEGLVVPRAICFSVE